VMVAIVDSPAKIQEAAVAVEEMLGDGLITISDVDTLRLVREPEKAR